MTAPQLLIGTALMVIVLMVLAGIRQPPKPPADAETRVDDQRSVRDL